MNAPRLNLDALHVRYGEREVLRGVSFALRAGEQVALLGPNGAGKSTLMKAAAGLLPASSGVAQLDGETIVRADSIADRVVYIAQEPPAAMDLTAGELVLTGLAPSLGAWSDGGSEGRRRAADALQATGTLALAARTLRTLSGGELRRVLFARALLRKPKLLLLDEPLAALDLGAQGQVLHLLRLAVQQGAAVLVALHDVNLARRSFPRALLLVNGALIADGPPETVLSVERVQAAYGAAELEGGYFFPRAPDTDGRP